MQLSKEQLEDAAKMASTPDLPNFSRAGTGKTHTTLHAMKLSGLSRHLVIAPKIAVSWWVEQAKEFLGADARAVTTAGSPLVGDVVVTTYGVARSIADRIYDEFDGGTLTLDESQYARTPEAKMTAAIFGQRTDLVGGIAERFDTVWQLSGTPMQNFANDYYTQAAVLHLEHFASLGITDYESFCKRFTYSAKRQYNARMPPVWKIVGSTNEALLGRIVYEGIGAIRRLDAPGMPDLRYRELSVPVRLSREVRAAMAGKSEKEILTELNDPDSVMAKVWKLVGLAKVDEVVPYIGDCYKSSPILLGCWHHEVIEAYKSRLTAMGLRVEVVTGKTRDELREPIRQKFNGGHVDVLIGQMKAMGVSWNLQEASHHVIVAETHPSPSVIEQFYKRVYRRGQTRGCIVDVMSGKDIAVDDALNGVRARKQKSNDKIG